MIHSPFPSKNAVSTESVILLIRSLFLSEIIILSIIKNKLSFDNFILFSSRLFIFSTFPLCNTLEYPCCNKVLSVSKLEFSIFVSSM